MGCCREEYLDLTRGWKRLHNEELPDLHSPNIIRMRKSRRLRGTEELGMWRLRGREKYIRVFGGGGEGGGGP